MSTSGGSNPPIPSPTKEVRKVSKDIHPVTQKVKELQDLMKEYDYVEEVDVDIDIHRSRNYVDTVEKAVEIMDDIFGEHVVKIIEDKFIVVKHDKGGQHRPFNLTIFLPLTDHNRELAMDEEFNEVVEEVNGDAKVNMS